MKSLIQTPKSCCVFCSWRAGFGLAAAVVVGFFSAIPVTASSELSGRSRFVTPQRCNAIRAKIENEAWAEEALARRKERVDKYVAKVQEEPDWAFSRLAMNWDTHYEQAIVEGGLTIGGDGRAPVPTPRTNGSRKPLAYKHSPYKRPSIEQMRPYNDKGGKMWLQHKKTGEFEWGDSSKLEEIPRRINTALMQLAENAAFLYWVTGDQRYAEFAAPILWVYMRGVAHMKPPRFTGKVDGGKPTSYLRKTSGLVDHQVIHDNTIDHAPLVYIYVRDYIEKRDDMDCGIIESGIKKFADRVIENGLYGLHNWNQIQASKIAKCGLALQDNDAYADGKGSSYYMNVVVNAQEMAPEGKHWRQTGLIQVIEKGYHPETALPPELGSYGRGNASKILRVAWLLPEEQRDKIYNHPVMKRVVFAQLQETYPSGYNVLVGVAGRGRVNSGAAELLLAHALQQGNSETAAKLSALLHREMEADAYRVQPQRSLNPFHPPSVDELPDPAPWEAVWQPPATFNAKPHNLVMMRSLPENRKSDYAITAAMYGSGSKARQTHQNGLAIELFGAGHILGLDPGIGGGRHGVKHNQYYKLPPAHNTVVVSGQSHGGGDMTIHRVEPPFEDNARATAADFVYIQGGYREGQPAFTQQRTLALVRIDQETAFFFEVFRSELNESRPGEYHDFFYHNQGDQLIVSDGSEKTLPLERSRMLTSEKGNQGAYDWFKKERSADHEGDLHAEWPLQVPDSCNVVMDLLMPGSEERRIFTVDAPNTRVDHGYGPKSLWRQPLPTLVVRQHGEAWDRPFVVVYAPRQNDQPRTVRSLQATGQNAWRVQGDGWAAELELKGEELACTIHQHEG